MTMLSRVMTRARQAAPWVLLGLAAILLVILGTQTRALRQEVRHLRGAQQLLHAGDVVPPVRVPRLGGDSVTLGAGPDRAQVLFVFLTTCPYCERALPQWDTIVGRVVGLAGVRVYGVSLDPDSATVGYVARHRLRFPMVRFGTAREAGTYRAIGSPITVVVDSAGTVLYARAGVLSAGAVDSLLSVILAGPRAQVGSGM